MVEAAVRITAVDGAGLTREDLRAELGVFNALEAEVWPEDPVTELEDALAAHALVPDRVQRTTFQAWTPGGLLAGYVRVGVDPENDDDPDMLDCTVVVRPEYRRRGIGTQLVEQVVSFARTEGRSLLAGRSYDHVPAGEAFAQSIGARSVSRTHTNHLLLRDVDRSLLERWVREAPDRAPGYELVMWDGPIPDEHLGDFVQLMHVMNDAPRDDLARNDFTLKPSQWREGEALGAAQGHSRWTVVARTRHGGELVGLHDIAWVPTIPGVGFIGSTGVRAEHRGFALGKWMKAQMTLRVLMEQPQATEIRTDNADSNDAMLGINDAMGYRPMMGSITWQLTLTDVQRARS